MAQRINEDIRFYLPADPYYYQVDNLPLEDLLANDVRLQSQIDDINSGNLGNTVGRAGFTELQPFIDAGLPGTISVRPGNFIGRVQRTSGNGLSPSENRYRMDNGILEVNDPPTRFGSGTSPTGTYDVDNPPDSTANPGDYVGRTSLINFNGGSISIDSFDFGEFEWSGSTTAPLGRIDLIGIDTMNGAMDDPHLPGNPEATGVYIGNGYAKLAVVKGAGMLTDAANGNRQVIVGEKYVTIGTPQEDLNDFGRNLDGAVVPNPEFGTVPSPDDVVNVSYARNIMNNGEIGQTLTEWAQSNRNASFFLPIAYVFVPQSHVEGAPIPEQYMRDIRPFFRTAELTLAERQAIAASLAPSTHNPFTTTDHLEAVIAPIRDDILTLEQLQAQLATITIQRTTSPNDNGGAGPRIRNGDYNGWVTYNAYTYGAPSNTTHVWINCRANTDEDWANAVAYCRKKGASNYVRYLNSSYGSDVRGVADWNVGNVLCPVDENGDFQVYSNGKFKDFELWLTGYISEQPLLG